IGLTVVAIEVGGGYPCQVECLDCLLFRIENKHFARRSVGYKTVSPSFETVSTVPVIPLAVPVTVLVPGSKINIPTELPKYAFVPARSKTIEFGDPGKVTAVAAVVAETSIGIREVFAVASGLSLLGT